MKWTAVVLFCLTAPACAQTLLTPSPYYADFHERWSHYVFRTYTDPQRAAWLLIDSAKDTVWKDPNQWDRSPESFSYRVASAVGRRIVCNTLQLTFETTLREDSRYRVSSETGVRRRAWFAVSHSVLAYGPDGSIKPAYGRMAAGVATAAISSTWHPSSIKPSILIGGIGDSALDRAANNLLTEFQPDLIHFGKKTWNTFTGK